MQEVIRVYLSLPGQCHRDQLLHSSELGPTRIRRSTGRIDVNIETAVPLRVHGGRPQEPPTEDLLGSRPVYPIFQ